MGASGWSYYVPCDGDVAAALTRCRHDTFAKGAYYVFPPKPEFSGSVEDRIAQLLESNDTEGTHSILDMMLGVSQQPSFGTVAPLSDARLVELFGTTRPDHAAVSALQMELMEERRRWQGTYVLVYDGDVVSEVLFIGFSGD